MNRISLVLLRIEVSLISTTYGQANQTPLSGEKTILINSMMEDIFGYFPGGGHVPFYEVEVPTIAVVSAGVHPHFHQPLDTVDILKSEVTKMATQFVLALINIFDIRKPIVTNHPFFLPPISRSLPRGSQHF